MERRRFMLIFIPVVTGSAQNVRFQPFLDPERNLTSPSFPSCKLAWNLNPLPRIQAPWAGNSETKTGEERKRQSSGPSSENRNRCPRVQPCPAIKTAAYAAPLTRLIMALLSSAPIKTTHTLTYKRKRVSAPRVSASPSGLKETSQSQQKNRTDSVHVAWVHTDGFQTFSPLVLCSAKMERIEHKARFLSKNTLIKDGRRDPNRLLYIT